MSNVLFKPVALRSLLLQVDPDTVILHYSVAANNELVDERDSLLAVLAEAFPETAKSVACVVQLG